MKNDTKKTLQYWLDWIESLKEWVHSSPKFIYSASSYTVDDVPYQALRLMAEHFKTRLYPEDKDHRQSLYIEVWHGMSKTDVIFRSPKRDFTYKKIKE